MRVMVEHCPDADREHAESRRQYCHVFHRPGVICKAQDFDGLPEGHRLGLLLHEVGHLLAGQDAGEEEADRRAQEYAGVPIHYETTIWGDELQWVMEGDRGRVRRALGDGNRTSNPSSTKVYLWFILHGKTHLSSAHGMMDYTHRDFVIDSGIEEPEGDEWDRMPRGLIIVEPATGKVVPARIRLRAYPSPSFTPEHVVKLFLRKHPQYRGVEMLDEVGESRSNPWSLSDATIVIDPQGTPHEEPGYSPRSGHPRIAQSLGYPGIGHAIVAGAVRAYIHNREVGVSFAHNNATAARNAVAWLETLRGSDADSVVIDTRRGGGDTKLYEMAPGIDAGIRFIREKQIQGMNPSNPPKPKRLPYAERQPIWDAVRQYKDRSFHDWERAFNDWSYHQRQAFLGQHPYDVPLLSKFEARMLMAKDEWHREWFL